MPTYILFMKMTDQGVKELKAVPAAIEEGIRVWQETGGKLIGFYAVMGEYDYIAVGEHPSEQAALSFVLRLSSGGNIRTTTLKAFTRQELTEAITKLP